MERRTSRARCLSVTRIPLRRLRDAPNPDVFVWADWTCVREQERVRRTRLSLAMAAGPGAVRQTTCQKHSEVRGPRHPLRTRHNARGVLPQGHDIQRREVGRIR